MLCYPDDSDVVFMAKSASIFGPTYVILTETRLPLDVKGYHHD
jgi:hypothetical protein